MTKIWRLMLVLFIFSCTEKKETPGINNFENVVESKKKPTFQPPPNIIKLYAFSEIVYTKLSQVYVPMKFIDNNIVPESYQTIQEDFVNLGEIQEIAAIPNEDDKYRYLDKVEQKLRERFNFHDGISWKIKSRELYIFDTYTEASKNQARIKEQETPLYSN